MLEVLSMCKDPRADAWGWGSGFGIRQQFCADDKIVLATLLGANRFQWVYFSGTARWSERGKGRD
jgi:hypothetical protein